MKLTSITRYAFTYLFLSLFKSEKASGFSPASIQPARTRSDDVSSNVRLSAIPEKNYGAISRRDVGFGAIFSFAAMLLSPFPARAGIDVSEATPVPRKLFVDPKGLFTIIVPENFFSLRRTSKGDLPDEKTGKGRRGSSIFTAGNMAKAEIVAVERYAFLDCCFWSHFFVFVHIIGFT